MTNERSPHPLAPGCAPRARFCTTSCTTAVLAMRRAGGGRGRGGRRARRRRPGRRPRRGAGPHGRAGIAVRSGRRASTRTQGSRPGHGPPRAEHAGPGVGAGREEPGAPQAPGERARTRSPGARARRARLPPGRQASRACGRAGALGPRGGGVRAVGSGRGPPLRAARRPPSGGRRRGRCSPPARGPPPARTRSWRGAYTTCCACRWCAPRRRPTDGRSSTSTGAGWPQGRRGGARVGADPPGAAARRPGQACRRRPRRRWSPTGRCGGSGGRSSRSRGSGPSRSGRPSTTAPTRPPSTGAATESSSSWRRRTATRS